jgi:hypothetical protein
MQSPPDVPEAISVLGASLLESIDLLLTDEAKRSWPDYGKLKVLLKNFFDQLPTSSDSIESGLDSFSSSGNPAELIKAVFDILTEAIETILSVEPNEVGEEIARFVGQLKDMVTTVGEALHEFEKGDVPASIETVYLGLRSVATSMLPKDAQDDAAFAFIVTALDRLVGGLSQDLMDFKKKQMNKTVCWKESKRRGWTKPRHCSDGYAWDYDSHCWPEECWEPSAKCASKFEYSGQQYDGCSVSGHHKPWCSHDESHKFWSGWDECTRIPCEHLASSLSQQAMAARRLRRVNGMVPAQCDPSSKFPDMTAGWCYEKCPQGFEPDEGRCWTTCNGGVGTDWPLMCGRDEGVLKSAATEMASSVLRAATAATMIFKQTQENGVEATTIKATIDMFMKLGKPFSYATCSKRHFDMPPTSGPSLPTPPSTPPVSATLAPSPMPPLTEAPSLPPTSAPTLAPSQMATPITPTSAPTLAPFQMATPMPTLNDSVADPDADGEADIDADGEADGEADGDAGADDETDMVAGGGTDGEGDGEANGSTAA